MTDKKNADREPDKQRISDDAVPTIREETFAYITRKAQGDYTAADLADLPENCSMELIDGVIYDMGNAPARIHQALAGELYFVLKSYIRANRGSCKAYAAPLAVHLDCDDRTVVQPDLVIVCDHSKLKDFGVFGAPDLVVEVLSPSTRKKDLGIKLAKYEHAGVREYWIVDPEQEKVLVYDFSQEIYPVIYGFESRIPVAIFEGKCVIDFAEIAEDLYTGEE